MPVLQIIDLPQDIFDKLVVSAEQNQRSLTQEAVIILEKYLSEEDSKRRKADALSRLQKVRHYFDDVSTDDMIAMVREDRDR